MDHTGLEIQNDNHTVARALSQREFHFKSLFVIILNKFEAFYMTCFRFNENLNICRRIVVYLYLDKVWTLTNLIASPYIHLRAEKHAQHFTLFEYIPKLLTVVN